MVFLSGSLPAQTPGGSAAQGSAKQKELQVVTFEEMKYPTVAQYAPYRSEGLVVIQVALDEQGKVSVAKAISGSFFLIPDALANIQRWRFQSEGAKSGIIVYNFRRVIGECGSLTSMFAFERPNLVTVTGCVSATEERVESIPTITGVLSDSDLNVVHVDFGLKYPPLAQTARVQGEVVLQVKLGDDGKMLEASALSGHPLLISASIENARRWTFGPNPMKMAILVYNFKLRSDDPGQFIFSPPNFVTITAAPRVHSD
jgi:outer membrane biosynthesis protein TonB